MSEECQLHGPMKQCCCNCKHHWQDNHHCTLDKDLRAEEGGCICSIKKGYACVVFKVMDPKEGMIHSGWPLHSIGCEMYSPLTDT